MGKLAASLSGVKLTLPDEAWSLCVGRIDAQVAAEVMAELG
jgi:hypothetical protein